MKKIVLIILSFFIIHNISAESVSGSGPFYLEDATVAPNSFRYISLKSLPKDRAYNITCNIEDPNYTKPYPAVIKVDINALPLGQYLLDHPITKITAKHIIPRNEYVTLIFTNYDDTDLIFIQKCMATYTTQ